MPDTSPTPVDIDAFERMLVETLPPWELRFASEVLSELRNLRSRTSIGPDSERIREAEQIIADALHDVACNNNPGHQDWTDCAKSGPCHEDAAAVMPALRAVGLLPGPDDIVVSREALTTVLDGRFRGYTEARASLRAALSQPHPEETP